MLMVKTSYVFSFCLRCDGMDYADIEVSGYPLLLDDDSKVRGGFFGIMIPREKFQDTRILWTLFVGVLK